MTNSPPPQSPLKPVIAIDGPAASGKGTLSRALAAELEFAHMDTGALYRVVALHLLQQKLDLGEGQASLAATHIRDHFNLEMLHDPALRTDEIGSLTSKVSAIPQVREILEHIQRDFAHNPPSPFKGAVLDGRDIGTVICPDANVKLYVTASAEIRAERRLKELQNRGLSASYDAVLKDMKERDFRDMNRDFRPLRPASDAIMIDTSDLTPAQALKQAHEIAVRTLGL